MAPAGGGWRTTFNGKIGTAVVAFWFLDIQAGLELSSHRSASVSRVLGLQV